MIIQRRLPLHLMLFWGSRTFFVTAIWATAVLAGYMYLDLEFLRAPFLPIATIGTAVAFYMGFKNNSAYDRFWEGRKVWGGGIVNTSRTWGTAVMSYVDLNGGGDARDQPRRPSPAPLQLPSSARREAGGELSPTCENTAWRTPL